MHADFLFIYYYFPERILKLLHHQLHEQDFGYSLQEQRVEMDRSKVEAITSCPIPLLNHQRAAEIPGVCKLLPAFFLSCQFHSSTPNITSKWKKTKALSGLKQSIVLFNCSKLGFTTTSILHHPDTLLFIVEVQTSQNVVGAVQPQCHGNTDKIHPCAFFSRNLLLELLAIEAALEQWRHQSFLILIDHHNLEYVKSAVFPSRVATLPHLFSHHL